MMQSGNEGEGGKGGSKKPPGKEKPQFSACDLSSEKFKKTWLRLKELHDKELRRLQAKLTSLRKERLAGGRQTGATAKIKELSDQQKALRGTLRKLRDQLSTKICDRCSVSEAYRNTLQQEFYDIQQRNVRLISELTVEMNKLRDENKELAERLKSSQKQLFMSTDSEDDDFAPTTKKKRRDYSPRDLRQASPLQSTSKLTKKLHTKEMKSSGKMEPPQSTSVPGKMEPPQSTSVPVPVCSLERFDITQTSFKKTSYSSKPTLGSSSKQSLSANFPSSHTLSSQRGFGFQSVSNVPGDKLKRKLSSTETSAMQKSDNQSDFSGNIPSTSTGENLATQVVSETSEENMFDYNILFPPFTKRRPSVHIFPLDYTSSSRGKKRSINLARCSSGFSVRVDSSQLPSKEQSTMTKNTDESTRAVYSKPRDKTESTSAVYSKPRDEAESTSAVYSKPRDEAESTSAVYSKPRDEAESTSAVYSKPRDEAESTSAVYSKPRDEAESTSVVYSKPRDEAESTSAVHIKPRDEAEYTSAVHIKPPDETESTSAEYIKPPDETESCMATIKRKAKVSSERRRM